MLESATLQIPKIPQAQQWAGGPKVEHFMSVEIYHNLENSAKRFVPARL